MREVVGVFQKGFSVGLRKNTSIANNVECLSECYNMVISKEGLVSRETVLAPFEYKEDFPFPMLYVGANKILFFTRNTVYEIVGDWDPVLLYSVKNDGLLEWGDVPHIADFQEYIVWATPNGTWKLQNGAVSKLSEWAGDTCCNFRQQMLMGEARLPLGPERAVDGSINGASVEIPTEGTVAWGIIGDMEFRYQLGQENGWMTLPFIGKVLAVIPMGDRVYVYHQNGVIRLTPVQEPIPTFGSMEFGNIGPVNRNCVAGDDNAHVFLGSDRKLYLVLPERALSDQGKSITELDYKEFMEKLENPIIAFDRVARHWWIGDNKRCFIYNGVGLSEASFTPTSLGNFNGQLLGFGNRHGSDYVLVTTNNISFNTRGIKTLMSVEADIRAEEAWGSVWWRSDFSKSLKKEMWKKVDPRGFFFPIVAGSELEISIKTNNYVTTHLSKLWIRYKITDRTSARGILSPGAQPE